MVFFLILTGSTCYFDTISLADLVNGICAGLLSDRGVVSLSTGVILIFVILF